MKVLVTGSEGFIGKNLLAHLALRREVEVVAFTRKSSKIELVQAVVQADFVFHLAGVNRPNDPGEFLSSNTAFTRQLCDALRSVGRQVPVLFASSIQAELENPYGTSKRAGENALQDYHELTGSPVHIFRLTNVFGKWCRPNYNSVVATFCHNISRDIPIQVNDPEAVLNLVYVDDVISRFLSVMEGTFSCGLRGAVAPHYSISLGELAQQIRLFRGSRNSLVTEKVGTGLTRALYATYMSYLPTRAFAYEVVAYGDPRGVFVEMLKTKDSGQFSFFTAHPGLTRGGHYHHSKTEKFLVIKGVARFKFRHILSEETYELMTNGDRPEIVETVPGWTHDITNIGDHEMIVMLWANEIFDRALPDTYACPV